MLHHETPEIIGFRAFLFCIATHFHPVTLAVNAEKLSARFGTVKNLSQNG